jgi:hypothetical protein
VLPRLVSMTDRESINEYLGASGYRTVDAEDLPLLGHLSLHINRHVCRLLAETLIGGSHDPRDDETGSRWRQSVGSRTISLRLHLS